MTAQSSSSRWRRAALGVLAAVLEGGPSGVAPSITFRPMLLSVGCILESAEEV